MTPIAALGVLRSTAVERAKTLVKNGCTVKAFDAMMGEELKENGGFKDDEQLQGVAGVAVEGLPQPELNDVYLPAGDHEGWPRFERAFEARVFHLFYHAGHRAWFLRTAFTPDDDARKSWVGAPTGRLPTGCATWLHGQNSQATDGWQERPLTLTACATEAEACTILARMY